MTKMPSEWTGGVPRRLPERQEISTEEKARRKAESEALYQRCRAIFERVRPELIADHYNWYIIIEPDSETYAIDRDEMIAIKKLRAKQPQGKVMIMRLNETGTCGRI
jgi:hypothetical protein